MLRRLGLGAAALAAMAAWAGSADAQNRDWYGRIAAHHAWGVDSNLADRNCASATATLGCSNAIRNGNFGSAWGFDAGIGRRLSPWLRSDLSIAGTFGADYRGTFTSNGAPAGSFVRGRAESLQFMANGAIDGAGIAPNLFGAFNPYAMAGLGLAVNRSSDMQVALSNGAAGDNVRISGRSHTSFAWQVGAGVQWRASQRIVFDVGYTYVDAGRVEASGGPLLRTINGATTAPNGDPLRADLRFHRLHLGVVVPFGLNR
jgi:opacity protein-like surface antigen